jgi:hypothetical protein
VFQHGDLRGSPLDALDPQWLIRWNELPGTVEFGDASTNIQSGAWPGSNGAGYCDPMEAIARNICHAVLGLVFAWVWPLAVQGASTAGSSSVRVFKFTFGTPSCVTRQGFTKVKVGDAFSLEKRSASNRLEDCAQMALVTGAWRCVMTTVAHGFMPKAEFTSSCQSRSVGG